MMSLTIFGIIVVLFLALVGAATIIAALFIMNGEYDNENNNNQQ